MSANLFWQRRKYSQFDNWFQYFFYSVQCNIRRRSIATLYERVPDDTTVFARNKHIKYTI